jgi:hypothetical protein
VAALADQRRAVSVDNEKGLAERAQESAQISWMLCRAKLPAPPAPEAVLRNYDGSFRIALYSGDFAGFSGKQKYIALSAVVLQGTRTMV